MRVYLDTNKWIDLARAESGHADGVPFRPVLECLRAHDVEVVLSASNFFEVVKAGNSARRERMATLMTSVSHGMFLRPFMTFLKTEVESRLRESLGWRPLDLRGEVVGRGLPGALGHPVRLDDLPEESKHLEGELLALARSPEFVARAMVQLHEPMREAALGAKETSGVEGMNSVRKRARDGRATKRTLAEHNLAWFFQNAFKPLFQEAIVRLRVSPGELERWISPPVASEAYLRSHRSIDAYVTITVERDSDWDRKVEANDIRDLEAMTMAVAYCDIVVAERYHAGIVRRSELAKRLNCRVISDLRELPALLVEGSLAQSG